MLQSDAPLPSVGKGWEFDGLRVIAKRLLGGSRSWDKVGLGCTQQDFAQDGDVLKRLSSTSALHKHLEHGLKDARK